MYQLKPALFPLREENIVDILRQRARCQPDKTAYVFLTDGETEFVSLTYAELDRTARFIGALLQSLDLTGKHALLVYPPGLEFITAFLGCLYAGVVAVPAYPPRRNQSMERLKAIIADAQATEVLTTTTVWKNLERNFDQDPELASMRWLATDNIASNLIGEGWDRSSWHLSREYKGTERRFCHSKEYKGIERRRTLQPAQLQEVWQTPAIARDTLAFLQYTSGSTGNPKGVMLTHNNLMHNLEWIQRRFEHTSHSQGVIWLPPYHDMGLIGGILQPLYGSFPVTLMSPVDFLQKPLRWLQAISQYQATTSGGPNFAYDLCVSKITPEQRANLDLSSWEVAFTGSEPVRAETLERFAQTFAPCGFRREAFYPCYGMSEVTLFVSGGMKEQAPVVQSVKEADLEQGRIVCAEANSESTRTLIGCGQAWLGQKVVIVDPQLLTQCPLGKVGEIWVSGASVALGYWGKMEQTQQVFQAYLADTGEGPFLRTGDLGFLREDGELFVTGRLKDIIIIRGRNHYPQDIELSVEQSHPSLRSGYGAAFGVEVKGEERLVVVQEVERSYLKKLDVEQVVGDIRQALTAQHGLQVYAVVLVRTGTIPKTSSGKIRRSACREKFLGGTLEGVEQGIKDLIVQKKKNAWSVSAVV